MVVDRPHPEDDAALRRGVVRSTASNLASRLVMLGTWFFLTPFMVHRLGGSQYGLWALVGSISAYGLLLDLGITEPSSSTSQSSEPAEKPRSCELFSRRAWGCFSESGLVLMLVGVILAPFIPHIFNVPADEHRTASWAVVAASLSDGPLPSGVDGGCGPLRPPSLRSRLHRGRRLDGSHVATDRDDSSSRRRSGASTADRDSDQSRRRRALGVARPPRRSRDPLRTAWLRSTGRPPRRRVQLGCVRPSDDGGARGQHGRDRDRRFLPVASVGPYTVARRRQQPPPIPDRAVHRCAPAAVRPAGCAGWE